MVPLGPAGGRLPGGGTRGWKPQVSTLLCARAASAHSPLRFSEKHPARQGRTRLRQFAYPAGSVQKGSRPSGANTLTQFECPGQPVQKRSRPDRANTLTQFARPAQPVLKKLPPRSSEPPARFVCPA